MILLRSIVTGGETSIDDCRKILFAQLRRMIESGTLSDMQNIHLINECGDDIVREIEKDVQRIIMNDDDMLQKDQIILATMIKSLSPLREVRVWRFTLEPSVIPRVKDCMGSADLFKVINTRCDAAVGSHIVISGESVSWKGTYPWIICQ